MWAAGLEPGGCQRRAELREGVFLPICPCPQDLEIVRQIGQGSFGQVGSCLDNPLWPALLALLCSSMSGCAS